MSKVRYIGPSAAAILVAAALRGATYGCVIRAVLPTSPPELAAYCELSGLNQFLAGAAPPPVERERSDTVPVMRFTHERADQAGPLIRLVRGHIDVTEDEEDYLRIALGEMFRNVEDHAKSPVGGVWTARFVPHSHEVRVAIVDMGEGIATTLRRAHPEIPNAAVALQRALVGGVSAKSIETNQGLGISNLAGIVRALRGELLIVTDDVVAELKAGASEPTMEPLGFRFPGTAVMFTLGVQGSET